MKLFMIAKNNIKKSKVASLTLIVLIALTTIFLYVGIHVLTQVGSFIDEKNDQINGAHEIAIASRDYNEEIKSIFEDIDEFSYMEQEDAILYSSSMLQEVETKEEKYAFSTLILNYDTDRTISNVQVIDKAEQTYENGIIVPYVLKVANGYQPGDTLHLYIEDKIYEFKIAGFYEDVMFSLPTNLPVYKLFVSNQQFHELEEEGLGAKYSVNVAILKNIQDSENFENTLLDNMKTKLNDMSKIYLTSNYLSLKAGASIFIMIIMSILMAFSGLILLISLIVIRFSTTTHIDNNIKNIGAMEACGYTPRQLIRAILLEYGMTGSGGIFLGIIIAIGITPFITEIVSSAIGLKWSAKPSMMAAAASLIIIIIFILTISYISGAKIKKITPLTALRSGIETHNFKKNRIPLDKTKLNVNAAIGVKEFIYNKRQNMVAGIIIMMLSLVCVLALSMYYNFGIDNSPMIKLVGLENAEVALVTPNDTKQILDEVRNMPEVKKVIMLDNFQMAIKYNGKASNSNIKMTEDFSKLQINTCVKGRMPEHDNEISMTSLVLKELGAQLGDTVSVEYNNQTAEYLVVGMTQHISYLGKGAEITTNGMQRLMKDFESKIAMIYLNENVDTSKFITKLSNAYKDKDIQVSNNKESLQKMGESYGSAIRIITIACIIITIIIIIFIMFLITRARVLKEKMRLGVYKALGYTSNQLVGHILISQIPVVMVSSVIGSIAGLYVTNPIVALSLASNGIKKCSFYVNPMYVVYTPIAISIIGFLTVIAVSLGIRKISPSKMFEQANN